MIHVSSEFKEIMMQRQDFKENAEVTFSDGTVLHLEEKDFSITNNSVVDSADANAVPIGAAICRNIQMELLNEDDHLEKYDFYGARIRLYLTFQLSDTIEKIEFGTFTVTAPECYGTTVVVNASDDMYKANVAYSTDLLFPATAGAVLRDACSRCSILMGTTSFLHDDFQIQTKPSGDYTFRQVIGYLAMIACGNARINRSGKLEILTYDLDFTRECHNLTEWKSLTMDTSDITITGIQTTRKVKKTEGEKETEVEETVRAGSEGYMLTVSNPLASGNEETLVSWIHEKISGVPFRRFTGDYITYPLAEFMDLAKITDWRGNSYHTFVTDVNFVFFGITTLKNSAESGMRNASKYGSEDTQTNVHLQELIEQERTDRQEAIEKLGDSLNAGGGLYATYEKQPDGSTITYLHDKPTLKESKTVIKITAEAIGVSNDGGKNYLYGFVLDGDIIARILYAHGIDADYINTGAIIVRDAETKEIIFSVDMDTGRVVISGDIIQIGGRPIGQALEDVKDYADKNLADYADSISKDLSSLQSQVDGQVEDWYYDYEPSMQNYPASQWTTTEERRKHIGDRFFWKSKGYAYRFMEDNGIWGWILLQDTDITKAMQAAMEAQDTADGKRRTFVTTPQPPYDIGDLWTNGEDILTATVARDKGTLNNDTGKYEATVTAPAKSSYNQSGHYYPVTVRATDDAGNTTTKDASDETLGKSLQLVVKEKVAPVSAITYPTSGAFITNATPAIAFKVTDEDSGINESTIKLTVDGSAVASEEISKKAVSGGYECTYTPEKALGNGAHTIKVEVSDHDGNAAAVQTVSFTVDTVPPTLSVTAPVEGYVTNQARLLVSGTTDDATSKPVTVTVNGEKVAVNENGTWSKTITLSPGANTITVVATDKAGKSTTVTRKVTLDTGAPVFVSAKLTPNPVDAGKTFIISVEVTD